MAPPGDEVVRYFCASGVLIAEARCPGVCDPATNTCKQSSGTGEGSGESELFSLLMCRECYANDCKPRLSACEEDAGCAAHLSCLETCTLEDRCFAICDEAFPNDALLKQLGACIETTDCPRICSAI
jgi:hypothetical protein